MEEILIEIAKQSAAVAVLIWVYIEKRKEIKELKKEKEELNKLMRDKDQQVIDSLKEQNEISNKLIEYINGKEEKKKR